MAKTDSSGRMWYAPVSRPACHQVQSRLLACPHRLWSCTHRHICRRYDSMHNAVSNTIIISEILDSRTRHLIRVSF